MLRLITKYSNQEVNATSQNIKNLPQHLLEKTFNCGAPDVNSILEFLWYCYTEYNPIHTQAIQEHFENLEPIMERLSFDDSTLLFSAVCALCVEYEKQAFLEGLHIGAHLHQELYEVN